MQQKVLMPLTLLLGLLIPLVLGLLAPSIGVRFAGAQEGSDGAQGGTDGAELDVCPPADQAMVGVWGQGRLKVMDPCQKASGTVLKAEHEPDGDLDLYVSLDPAYDQLAGSAAELNSLHGWGPGDVLVELMPRDSGHLPAPVEGDHLDLWGAWVTDANHGYKEIHPIWSESINGAEPSTSGPKNGGSLLQSTASTAAADCKNANGAHCIGYSE